MTFEQLQYFIAVYQCSSISQAAEQLHIARQSLSESLRKLEEECALPLFIRSRSGTTSTEAGDIFYRHACNILQEQSVLMHSLDAFKHPAEAKVIRIGLSDVISSVYGDELAEKLSDAFPGLHFNFYQINYVDDALAYTNYDIFVTHFPNPTSPELLLKNNNDYIAYRLGEDKFYVWISANSPLNKLPVITAEHLKNHSGLVLRNVFNSSMISQFYSSGHNYNIKLKTAFVDFLENNLCYALDAHLNHGNLIYADILKGKNVVLKETDQVSYLGIICKKSAELFLPTIASVIS